MFYDAIWTSKCDCYALVVKILPEDAALFGSPVVASSGDSNSNKDQSRWECCPIQIGEYSVFLFILSEVVKYSVNVAEGGAYT